MGLLRITEKFNRGAMKWIRSDDSIVEQCIEEQVWESKCERKELIENIKKGGELANQRKEELEKVEINIDWCQQLKIDLYDSRHGMEDEDFIMDRLNKFTKLKCDHEKINPSTTNEDCEEKKTYDDWEKKMKRHEYDIDKLKNLMKNVDNRNMRLQFDLKWSTNLSNTLRNKNDKKTDEAYIGEQLKMVNKSLEEHNKKGNESSEWIREFKFHIYNIENIEWILKKADDSSDSNDYSSESGDPSSTSVRDVHVDVAVDNKNDDDADDDDNDDENDSDYVLHKKSSSNKKKKESSTRKLRSQGGKTIPTRTKAIRLHLMKNVPFGGRVNNNKKRPPMHNLMQNKTKKAT